MNRPFRFDVVVSSASASLTNCHGRSGPEEARNGGANVRGWLSEVARLTEAMT